MQFVVQLSVDPHSSAAKRQLRFAVKSASIPVHRRFQKQFAVQISVDLCSSVAKRQLRFAVKSASIPVLPRPKGRCGSRFKSVLICVYLWLKGSCGSRLNPRPPPFIGGSKSSSQFKSVSSAQSVDESGSRFPALAALRGPERKQRWRGIAGGGIIGGIPLSTHREGGET